MRSVRRAGLALTVAAALTLRRLLGRRAAARPAAPPARARPGPTPARAPAVKASPSASSTTSPASASRRATPSRGFDVDVAKYVAGKLGYAEDKIKFVESVSSQRETLLENGSVDMIFATYSITDARKERVAFAGPYFVAGQDLLVAADNTDITGPDSLNGKVLCSVEGSTSAQRIRDEHSKDAELYPAQTYSECVELLSAGTVDAVTTDDVILAGYAAQPAVRGQVQGRRQAVLRGELRRRPAQGQHTSARTSTRRSPR